VARGTPGCQYPSASCSSLSQAPRCLAVRNRLAQAAAALVAVRCGLASINVLPLRWYPWLQTWLRCWRCGARDVLRSLRRPILVFTISALTAAAPCASRALTLRRLRAGAALPARSSRCDPLLPAPETNANARQHRRRRPGAAAARRRSHRAHYRRCAARRSATAAIEVSIFQHAMRRRAVTAWSISSLLTGMRPISWEIPRRCGNFSRPRLAHPGVLSRRSFFDGRRRRSRGAHALRLRVDRHANAAGRGAHRCGLKRLSQLEGEPRMFLWVHYFDAHDPIAGKLRSRGDDCGSRDRTSSRRDEISSRPVIVMSHRPIMAKSWATTAAPITTPRSTTSRCACRWYRCAGKSCRGQIYDPVEPLDLAPLLSSLADRACTGFAVGHDAHAQVGTRRMLVRGRWKLIHDRAATTTSSTICKRSARASQRFDEMRQIAQPLHARSTAGSICRRRSR